MTIEDGRRGEGPDGRRRSDAPSSGGFTLTELLVAVIILTIGVLGLAKVLIGSSQRQAQVESHQELLAVAEEKLEELRNIAASGTADTVQLEIGGSLTADVANYADSIQTPEGRWYHRRWQVTAGPAETRSVTLRILAPDPGRTAVDSRDFTSLVLVEDS